MFQSMHTLNFNTIQFHFLCKHILDFSSQPFHVSPFASFFVPSILRLFQRKICLLILLVYPAHTSSLFDILKFLGCHCLALPFFPTRLSIFSSKLFYVRLFLGSLIWFSNPCISCMVSLKLVLTKLIWLFLKVQLPLFLTVRVRFMKYTLI